MQSTPNWFTQNSITREFIQQVNDLVNRGLYDFKDLATALSWNKSSLSQVVNGARNVPIEKWEVFKEVYKSANAGRDRRALVAFDMSAAIKKIEIMMEVLLSATAELVAEKHNFPASVVREQFQAVVNARLSNAEPKQSEGEG